MYVRVGEARSRATGGVGEPCLGRGEDPPFPYRISPLLLLSRVKTIAMFVCLLFRKGGHGVRVLHIASHPVSPARPPRLGASRNGGGRADGAQVCEISWMWRKESLFFLRLSPSPGAAEAAGEEGTSLPPPSSSTSGPRQTHLSFSPPRQREDGNGEGIKCENGERRRANCKWCGRGGMGGGEQAPKVLAAAPAKMNRNGPLFSFRGLWCCMYGQ